MREARSVSSSGSKMNYRYSLTFKLLGKHEKGKGLKNGTTAIAMRVFKFLNLQFLKFICVFDSFRVCRSCSKVYNYLSQVILQFQNKPFYGLNG